MKIKLFSLSLLFVLVACQRSEDKQVQQYMQCVDSLYQAHAYAQTLDAIRALRVKFPHAIEARKQALKIWQDASLKMTQEDIARTDSALQAAQQALQQASTIGERNVWRVRRDSLQVRFDALCGTVRVIHRRQKEGQ